MQFSGSCLRTQTLTWQVVVLEAVVVGASNVAKKEASHPESQPLIIGAVSHPASLSVRLPVCLSTGSWLSAPLLCFVSCKSTKVFIGEQPGRKRAALLVMC